MKAHKRMTDPVQVAPPSRSACRPPSSNGHSTNHTNVAVLLRSHSERVRDSFWRKGHRCTCLMIALPLGA